LVKNKDILASLGSRKKEGQLLVGFALETTDELNHAMGKMKAKNADMIVLNSLKDSGAGFGHDTNKVTLLDTNGGKQELPLQSKQDTADAIVNHILILRHAEKAI
jgi:phosphopantothenoylcysteine decarboxylase/phosphopantothenate--cysteine ligase